MGNDVLLHCINSKWVVTEDGVDYPITVKLGGDEFELTWPNTFEFTSNVYGYRYEFRVVNNTIDSIVRLDDTSKVNHISTLAIPRGRDIVSYFLKTRMVDGVPDTCHIGHHFNRQIYPSF